MYSDEQIRQIIFDYSDEESPDCGKAFDIVVVDKTRDPRFLTAALEMLQEDSDKSVGAALSVMRSLKKFHPPDILQQILPFLDNPIHWTSAIQVIRGIRDASALPRLLAFLIYPDLEARVAALGTICVLGHPQISEICLSFINDADPDMRCVVCAILGELSRGKPGMDDYTDLLISISQNASSYDVQYSAAYALEAIGTTKALEAYYYWYDFKRKS
jgi:hypothetical protein